MSAPNKTIHVLRGILRHLKVTLPEAVANKKSAATTTTTRQFVLEEYRAHRSMTDKEETARKQQLALDYLHLQQDLKQRIVLYELDAGAENVLTPIEMSRRSAARAGLQMPDLYPNLQ